MALTVEDGTGLAAADAYVSVAMVESYAASRGLLFSGSIDHQESAIRRSTAYLDAAYSSAFTGQRLRGRLQALQWPRSGAVDADGLAIDPASIPIEIKNATCECAIRELASPGSLTPDLERGGSVKSIQAGSVEIVYADGASPLTVMRSIDLALAGLIGISKPGGISSGRLVRA